MVINPFFDKKIMSKDVYHELVKDEKAFARICGVKRGLFEDLYVLVAARMEEQKEEHPVRKRGRKTVVKQKITKKREIYFPLFIPIAIRINFPL